MVRPGLARGSRVLTSIAIAASAGRVQAEPPERSPQELAPPPPAPPPLTDPSSPEPEVRAQRNLRLLGRFFLDVGGDEIIHLKLPDGREQGLDAGQGLGLSAGLMYQSTFPLAIEATIGFKLALIASPSGDVVFNRFPLDVIVSVADVGHRIGIGATRHLQPSLSCNISGVCSQQVTFDTAHGLLLQYAYSTEHSNRALDLGVRLTLLHYASDNETFNANSIGVFVSGRL